MANAPIANRSDIKPLDRAGAIAAALALAPTLRERAETADAARGLSDRTIADIRRAGLFGIATPRAYGGAELGFATLVDIQAELASACGSTGWVYGVLTGHNWMLSLFTKEAQEDVFSDPDALTASVFRLGGRTVPVAGGYRLTDGEGRFCSGVDHSRWVVVGNAVQRPDGAPEPRFHLVPMSDVEVIDDWRTVGMRGTGSRSIRIKDAFIPEHRSVGAAALFQGTSPGAALHRNPFYAAPFAAAQPFSLIGAPLGMARGALAAFCNAQIKKLDAMDPAQAGEHGALFARISSISAEIDAAFATILRNAARLDDDPSPLSPTERAKFMRDFAYAAQKCRYAITALFEASGGSGIYDGGLIQRFWRDANASAAHAAFGWDDAATGFGRAALGLAPSKFGRR